MLYLYERCCTQGEDFLNSTPLAIELLSMAFENCQNAYIILDGLDECSRDQRKTIVKWFRDLIENLPATRPERLRCIFISQDDGFARKDFAGLASLQLRLEDTQQDIDTYCQVEARKLPEHFHLSKEEVQKIATTVAKSVKGNAGVLI
jgi:hypothetical protein